MLTSLIFSLKSPTAAELPASLGRAVQSLFFRLLEARDADLTQALHNSDGPKPFTASNLVMPRRKAGTLYLRAGADGWLRFTGLTAEISRHIQALAEDPPPRVEIDGHTFIVSEATLDNEVHAWAGQISYQALAAPFLLAGKSGVRSKLRLEFASPTTFRSSGRYIPLPQPEHVFGSLLDRWQAFAPIALHPDMRRFAAETVVLSRYHLRTRGTPYKQKGVRIGFVGEATFAALNKDRYWLNVLHLLANFAFYSGVGYQTGSGMGQVRLALPHGRVKDGATA